MRRKEALSPKSFRLPPDTGAFQRGTEGRTEICEFFLGIFWAQNARKNREKIRGKNSLKNSLKSARPQTHHRTHPNFAAPSFRSRKIRWPKNSLLKIFVPPEIRFIALFFGGGGLGSGLKHVCFFYKTPPKKETIFLTSAGLATTYTRQRSACGRWQAKASPAPR